MGHKASRAVAGCGGPAAVGGVGWGGGEGGVHFLRLGGRGRGQRPSGTSEKRGGTRGSTHTTRRLCRRGEAEHEPLQGSTCHLPVHGSVLHAMEPVFSVGFRRSSHRLPFARMSRASHWTVTLRVPPPHICEQSDMRIFHNEYDSSKVWFDCGRGMKRSSSFDCTSHRTSPSSTATTIVPLPPGSKLRLIRRRRRLR